jgi:hypothetical protein
MHLNIFRENAKFRQFLKTLRNFWYKKKLAKQYFHLRQKSSAHFRFHENCLNIFISAKMENLDIISQNYDRKKQ